VALLGNDHATISLYGARVELHYRIGVTLIQPPRCGLVYSPGFSWARKMDAGIG
jgi:hypothetical protein